MMNKNLLLIAALCLAAMALLMTIVPGFRFSIVLCFSFAALLVVIFFLLKYPTPVTRLLLKLICAGLLLGTLAAAVPGSFILRAAHPAVLPDCDYIVVLGAGVRGTVPSLTLSERIQAAYAYLTDHPDTVAVLSGGQGPDEQITEAACMYRELTNMGIDGTRLLSEEKSTSTIENLRFSMEVIGAATGEHPIEIGVISSEYHIFRATRFARDLGLQPVGIPAKTSWVTLRINYYLREIVAVWKYWVLGP